MDPSGNIYIAGDGPNSIRRVDAQTGIISTAVGGGEETSDGVPAADVLLGSCRGLAVDEAGNLYFADTFNTNRIRKVDVETGVVTTLAGNGSRGFSGDGGPATEAMLHFPESIALDTEGNLYIADTLKLKSNVEGTLEAVVDNLLELRKVSFGKASKRTRQGTSIRIEVHRANDEALGGLIGVHVIEENSGDYFPILGEYASGFGSGLTLFFISSGPHDSMADNEIPMSRIKLISRVQ